MTKVGFHPAASGEFRETASYYEHHVTGLGEEFLAEVERVCALLAAYPALGVSYDAGDRRALLRRFPTC